MQKTDFIWQNGKFIPWDEAKVHVLSHTLHYGGGAFEGIRLYQTPKGPAIFRLVDHIKRLIYSAQCLEMQLNYSMTDLAQIMLDLVNKNKLEHGYIRPLVYFGYGSLGVSARDNPVELMIACWPWGRYLDHDSVDVKVSKYIRLHQNSIIPDAKLCGSYLNSQLAAMEIRNTHYHEVLLLDADGDVAEGPGENFFIVKDGTLYTPALKCILPGLTRATIIELAEQENIPVKETVLTLQDVFNADEAFFTGTAAEVTAIRSLDDKAIGKSEIGKITRLIKQRYQEIVSGQSEAFEHYLTYTDEVK